MTNVTSADVKASVDLLKSGITENVNAATNLGTTLADTQAADAARVSAKTATQARDGEAQALYAGANAKATQTPLSALSAAIGGSPVDICIYDTSLDSDGGAWRKRCRGTSWENEALVPGKWLGEQVGTSQARAAGGVTGDYFYYGGAGTKGFYQLTDTAETQVFRGNRRDFPAVALIVAEADRVVIYDADDPDLPMWTVFPTSTPPSSLSLAARNAHLVLGCAYPENTGWARNGVQIVNFVADTIRKNAGGGFDGGYSRKTIAEYELIGVAQDYSGRGAFTLIQNTVNDVAITTLPDAPIDPVTKLPVPTIAVATDGGVSVIKDDGTVANSQSTLAHARVFISPDGVLYAMDTAFADDIQSFGPVRDLQSGFQLKWQHWQLTDRGMPLSSQTLTDMAHLRGGLAAGTTVGLDVVQENPNVSTAGMVAYVAADCTSGWQVGLSQGAWLADTDTSSLSNAELIENGDFSAGASGWESSHPNDPGIDWSVTGQVTITEQAGTDRWIRRNLPGVKAGDTVFYKVVISESTITGNAQFRLGYDGGSSPYVSFHPGPGTYEGSFVARRDDPSMLFLCSGTNDSVTLNNVSFVKGVSDRSVKQQGLTVNGTITRTPVAEGAELVKYRGFSTVDYLEQPYHSSDLDFGTEDFCVMAWGRTTSDSHQTLFGRYAPDSAGSDWRLTLYNDGRVSPRINGPANRLSDRSYNDGAWHLFMLTRRGDRLYTYVDGVEVTDQADTGNYNNSSARFAVGLANVDAAVDPWVGDIALVRVSKTAPTPEQIARIYEDERKLFLPGAKCTLTGTSSDVQSLAHDPHTGLLHVATPSGRSTFDGLVRVAETDTPRTKIAALNGMIAEH